MRATLAWSEARESYPQGVASGDPQENAVLLWTRYGKSDAQALLTAELADWNAKKASLERGLNMASALKETSASQLADAQARLDTAMLGS